MFTKKLLKGNGKIILFVLIAFIAWRAWLQAFLWLGWFVLPLKELLLGGGLENFFARPGLWAWANFDGNRYLAIAHHGYGNFEQAFFPFYIWLIKTFAFSFKESPFALLLSGLTISHLAFLVALFLLYSLIRLDFNRKVAQIAVLFLLVFPTSFFFGAVYTESLFLFLVLASFYFARNKVLPEAGSYFARTKRWWLAGIFGAFASATRVVGIFLLPALAFELWQQHQKKKITNYPFRRNLAKRASLTTFIPLLLIPLGLLYYMRFLQINYQDPLMFLHAQSAFGAQRTTDKIILLYQVFWRYLKMIATTKADPLYFTVWLEFLTAAWFAALLVFAYLKKIRFSYLIFAFFAYITPTLTGTFSSMPRYVLVLFPCFIALALIENKFLRWALIAVSCLLLAVSTIFFTKGYWIG